MESTVTSYNCKSCRTVLFQDSDLSLHEKGGDGVGGSDPSLLTEAVYRKLEKESKKGGASNTECSSHFVKDPIEWMMTGQVDGKLACPGCKTKVGSYNWSGSQCNCGAWVSPALQVVKSKVDRKTKIASAAPPSLTESVAAEGVPQDDEGAALDAEGLPAIAPPGGAISGKIAEYIAAVKTASTTFIVSEEYRVIGKDEYWIEENGKRKNSKLTKYFASRRDPVLKSLDVLIGMIAEMQMAEVKLSASELDCVKVESMSLSECMASFQTNLEEEMKAAKVAKGESYKKIVAAIESYKLMAEIVETDMS